MDFLEFCRILTVVASCVMAIGVYLQAWKIWKTKSAKDFSWTIIFAIVFNEVAWLLYGLALHEWPIILVSIINFPGILGTTSGFLKYRNI